MPIRIYLAKNVDAYIRCFMLSSEGDVRLLATWSGGREEFLNSKSVLPIVGHILKGAPARMSAPENLLATHDGISVLIEYQWSWYNMKLGNY